MLGIAGSSIGLACENPVDEFASVNLVLAKMDYGFTILFTCEMVLKVELT
jgi:hypothetical protein